MSSCVDVPVFSITTAESGFALCSTSRQFVIRISLDNLDKLTNYLDTFPLPDATSNWNMTYVYSSGLRIEAQPTIRLTEQKDLEDVVVRLKVHPPLLSGYLVMPLISARLADLDVGLHLWKQPLGLSDAGPIFSISSLISISAP